MDCPFCKLHPISVAIIQPEGENVFELGLCEHCAKKFNLFEGSCPSVQALAQRLATGGGGAAGGAAAGGSPKSKRGKAAVRDEAEGSETAKALEFPASLTDKLKSFQKTGRLSGPDDYTAMESQLKMLFQKIQGGDKHTGKSPHAPKAVHERKSRRAQLEEELGLAVKAENYEKAAALRDQIKNLARTEPDSASDATAEEAQP